MYYVIQASVSSLHRETTESRIMELVTDVLQYCRVDGRWCMCFHVGQLLPLKLAWHVKKDTLSGLLLTDSSVLL